jgi:hypothetical protein
VSARHLQAYAIDVDQLLALLTACGAPVPQGAKVVGLRVIYYAGIEVIAEHPSLPPIPQRTAPPVRGLDLAPVKEKLMEKQGVIRPGMTPPEDKDKQEKAASAEELERHVTKRTADAAEAALRKAPPGDKPCGPSR